MKRYEKNLQKCLDKRFDLWNHYIQVQILTTKKDSIMKPTTPVPESHCRAIFLTCLAIVAGILIWVCTSGCVTTSGVQPVCCHNAIYCAVTWSDLKHERVRIALGPATDGRQGRHVQAQAQEWKTGKWYYLNMSGGAVHRSVKDSYFQPNMYFTVYDYINMVMTFDDTKKDSGLYDSKSPEHQNGRNRDGRVEQTVNLKTGERWR